MHASHSPAIRSDPPAGPAGGRRAALLAGLAAAALAASPIHLPMGYGLDLVLGSVLSMLALY
jgi:hypothetical protein